MKEINRQPTSFVDDGLDTGSEEHMLIIELGLKFLEDQLAVVESKIEAHAREVDQHYPAGQEIPLSEQDLMEVYQQEKALIQELAQECVHEPFIEASRKRLASARQRLKASQGLGQTSELNQDYILAWFERELITTLVRDWLAFTNEHNRE